MSRSKPWILVLLGAAVVVLAIVLTVQGLGVSGTGGTFSPGRLMVGGLGFAVGLILIGNGAWKLKQP